MLRVENANSSYLQVPGGSDGKESTCNVGDLGSIPGLGRSPGGGKCYPLQWRIPIDRRAWQATARGLQRVGHDRMTTDTH